MKYRRKASLCSECPLRERKRVWGEGEVYGNLAIYGEAPGAVEAQEGRPFVGPSGGLLNWALEGYVDYCENGLQEPECVRLAIDEYKSEEDTIGQFCLYAVLTAG